MLFSQEPETVMTKRDRAMKGAGSLGCVCVCFRKEEKKKEKQSKAMCASLESTYL